MTKDSRSPLEVLITHATRNASRFSGSDTSLSTTQKEIVPRTTKPVSLLLEGSQAQLLTIEEGFAFAYWNLNAQALDSGIHRLGSTAKLFLRFYDVTKTPTIEQCEYWDTQVFDREGNWYLKLEYPEQKLCFDVLLKDRHGETDKLIRSNLTRLAADPFTSNADSPAEEPQLEEVMGPYFYQLFKGGQLGDLATTSLAALFQDVAHLKPTVANRLK